MEDPMQEQLMRTTGGDDVLSHEGALDDAGGKVIDLTFGRWRSQILYTGLLLGVFDALASGPKSAARVAGELELDRGMLYRLMRALGSLGLLKENNTKSFSLTPSGELLRQDHPHSLRAMTLLEEGPEHYAAWKHLPALVKEGKQNGFAREFGQPAFEYAVKNPSYGAVFNEAMSSYSGIDNMMVLEALESYDFSRISHLCDVAGGHGYALCGLLAKYRHLEGTVLELPGVIAKQELLWAEKMGLGARCTYVPGDMFREVPAADAYMVKRVLHDWSDAECVQILSNMHQAAPKHGKVFVIEQVVSGPDTPHFSKLFDIHMLVWGTGLERTVEEYAGLLERAGWKYRQTWYPPSKMLGIVEGVKE
jgi:hypothetical protein